MATQRVCSTPGCPTLVTPDARGGRCTTHARDADRARGTRTQRGYGRDHQAARAAIVKRMRAGETIRCWRCGTELTPTWIHLDHDDSRTGYRGPACPTCNLHLAGVAAHRRVVP